jgi:hypothetical protein
MSLYLVAGQNAATDPCTVPELDARPLTSGFVESGQAARWYSLITPPRIRRRRIGASIGMTTLGSWFGGRWARL